MIGGAVAARAATVHSAYLAETGAALREYELPADLMDAVLGGGADSALATPPPPVRASRRAAGRSPSSGCA